MLVRLGKQCSSQRCEEPRDAKVQVLSFDAVSPPITLYLVISFSSHIIPLELISCRIHPKT